MNDIRIPGVDSAIKYLRPNAKFSLMNNTICDWDCIDGTEPPSWEEIEQQILEDIQVYNYYLYARNRQSEYGNIGDQLDMLYHDIKSGNLENGSWVSMIESIKKKYPKPE